jgi:hypothetical protein
MSDTDLDPSGDVAQPDRQKIPPKQSVIADIDRSIYATSLILLVLPYPSTLFNEPDIRKRLRTSSNGE